MAENAMTFGRRLVVSAFLLSLVACSQNSKSTTTTTTGGGSTSTNSKPVATITSPSGSVSTESGYTLTFKASATDADITDTIQSFIWDFGDTTSPVTVTTATDPNGTTTHAFTGTSGEDKSFTVTVKAVDSRGLAGDSATVTVSIPANAGPKASITSPVGTLKVAPAEAYTFRAQVDPTTILPGTTLKSYIWNFGDGTPTVTVDATTTPDGSTSHAFASAVGSPFNVTVAAVSSLNNTGASSTPVSVDVNASYANQTPVITVTTPSTPTTSAFTSKPVTLGFTIQDGNGDSVTYTVAWGDGATSTGTASGTLAGASISLNHTYADAFTSTTATANVTINATDNRSTNGNATPATRTFNVAFNTLPTAAITTPQASGTLPAPGSITSGGQGLPTIPVTASSPDVVVIPANGKLAFSGTGTNPGSGDAITYQWTFNGGLPATSTSTNPGDVIFPGVAGQIVAYLVDFKAIDPFGRASSNSVKNRQKWVVVDATNTKSFGLNFLFRTKADNNGNATAATAVTSANGLDSSVQIFQDGLNSTWTVNSAGAAQISIPVRGNLPFWVLVPKFGTDTREYLLRIPNTAGQDPSLEASLPATASRFTFVSGNPTLYLISGQGFASEIASAAQRRLQGSFYAPASYPAPPPMPYLLDMEGYASPATSRWLDRLAVPLTDALGSRVNVGSLDASYSGISGYQSFAEWIVSVKSLATKDYYDPDGAGPTASTEPTATSVAAGKDDLGFVIDYNTFKAPTVSSPISQSYMATGLQVFRAPAGSTDPYNADTAGGATSGAFVATTPAKLTAGPSFYNGMIWNAPGGTALAGGINSLSIPYDANDPDRDPSAAGLPKTYYANGPVQVTADTFSFAEYLWSSVWSRPLVLNRASLNSTDTASNLSTYADYHYSSASTWPALSGIAPTNSAFNVTPAGGTDFTPGSTPVTEGGSTLSPTSVGRFFWTAFTPHYSAASGALISRTWLSQGSSDANAKNPPVTFTSGTGDATAAFGFVPPQDTVVDKRGRDANGALTGASLGGYRVTWYNPTKDSAGSVVAPDFWVVELNQGTTNRHFLLPGNFPVAAQAVTDAILTDARTYLPSGSATLQAGDKVAPGYCWFDIPVELRPTNGATLRVYGVKAILKNHPATNARALNRTEWIEAIKTATATMKMITSAGDDITYAHKLPFNYYWDIVIANGPATPVAP